MGHNQNIENSIEVVLSEFNYWYESIILDLVSNRQITSPLNNEVMFELIKTLNKYEQGRAVEKLNLVKSDLDVATTKLLDSNDKSNKREDVQMFMDTYGRLVSHLRSCMRNNKDNSNLDNDTGLKKQSELSSSYKTEIERLNRHREPFTLCLMRCDNIWHKEIEDTTKFLKLTSDVVLANLRVFDDAFRWNGEYIIAMLKHTGDSGGLVFFERVQRQFDTIEKIDEVKITVSACITSPVEGKKLEELLSEMKKDLDETCKDVRDDCVTMAESTDLQKFLGSE